MFWCKTCKYISRNDFTIIFSTKYGFGWLYRDFFFTFPNTFDRWLYLCDFRQFYFKNKVRQQSLLMARVVFSYGPSCLNIQADLFRSKLSAGRVVLYPLQQVGCILRVLGTVLPIKLTDTSNITEILLQVALNTISVICMKYVKHDKTRVTLVPKSLTWFT